MPDTIVALCLLIFAGSMAWAGVSDLLTMKIPNKCVLLLFAAFLAVVPFAPMSWAVLADHAIVMTGVLVLTFALFMFNALGAGDGKLIAVSTLWLGGTASIYFVLMFAALGGFVALGVLLMRSAALPVRLATHPVVVRLQSSERPVPYGLAIAPAGVLSLPYSPWAAWVPFLPTI